MGRQLVKNKTPWYTSPETVRSRISSQTNSYSLKNYRLIKNKINTQDVPASWVKLRLSVGKLMLVRSESPPISKTCKHHLRKLAKISSTLRKSSANRLGRRNRLQVSSSLASTIQSSSKALRSWSSSFTCLATTWEEDLMIGLALAKNFHHKNKDHSQWIPHLNQKVWDCKSSKTYRSRISQ